MPGPTWPNRMFLHAASSGGLDHSPTTAEIVEWELLDGFSFSNGNIFQALKAKGIPYHLYSGDEFPMVSSVKGIGLEDVQRIDDLVNALERAPFPYGYVFIEPSYDVLNDYRVVLLRSSRASWRAAFSRRPSPPGPARYSWEGHAPCSARRRFAR